MNSRVTFYAIFLFELIEVDFISRHRIISAKTPIKELAVCHSSLVPLWSMALPRQIVQPLTPIARRTDHPVHLVQARLSNLFDAFAEFLCELAYLVEDWFDLIKKSQNFCDMA